MFYLDANGSSQLRPEVREFVVRMLMEDDGLGNASSVHQKGQRARALLSVAREQVKKLFALGEPLDCDLVFTSGASEGANSLVYGFTAGQETGHIVSSAIEHPAMAEPIAQLKKRGWEVDLIAPDENGVVSPAQVVSALRANTVLVSIIAAHNETGSIQPVEEIARGLRQHGYSGAIVTDFTQAFGKLAWPVGRLFAGGVNALCVSAHKLGALKGTGAVLINRQGVCLEFLPFILGGPQEQKRRAGTENVLGAAAFGVSCETVLARINSEAERVSALRDTLWTKLSQRLARITRLSLGGQDCLPNTLLVSFDGVRGDELVMALDLAGVCVSFGSACSSGKLSASDSLLAMGLSENKASTAVRFSLDWDITASAISDVAHIVEKTVKRMRGC